MNQTIRDERTTEQKQSPQYFVMGMDTFMSGWGMAEGKISYGVWMFDSEDDMPKFLKWIKGRGDMKHIMSGTTRNLEFLVNSMALNTNKGPHHISIYTTDRHHPALTEKK